MIIAFSTIPLGATSLKMMNLADMVGHSERIFSGICQAVSSGLDENNMPYTSYSFRVTDSIYGIANQQVVVVKQFGLAEPIQLDNGMTRVTPYRRNATICSWARIPALVEQGELTWFFSPYRAGSGSISGAGDGNIPNRCEWHGQRKSS